MIGLNNSNLLKIYGSVKTKQKCYEVSFGSKISNNIMHSFYVNSHL